MLRVGIVGVSGYTGVELARILSRHPEIEISIATSRQFEGKHLGDVYPNLRGCLDITCENPAPDALADRADFFFTAVPHQTAMEIVPPLIAAGKKVVDLSADYRIRDLAVYEQWYQRHTSGELIRETAYGLSELYRDSIKDAKLVANPGCYPTSVILGLAPLLREKLIDPSTIIVDSKSGASGAGRSANIATLFCEVADGFKAYKTGGTHRHIPEMEQELTVLADTPVTISFTPHLLPITRGILSTMYAKLTTDISREKVQALYEQNYADEYFIRLCPGDTVPATQHVRGSNFCDIGISLAERAGRIIVFSAIDNIVKGAAGQAVQNMNLMNGFAEDTGLRGASLFP
jgi:N-acetyl-gamma-glutamyl-phosphate reductase